MKGLKTWVEKNWGKRCDKFELGCPLCTAWQCFDFITKPGKRTKLDSIIEKELNEKEFGK